MWVRSALVASVALGFRVDRSPRGALLKAPKTAASLGAAEGSGAEEEAGLSQEEVAFVSTPEEAPPAVTFISESPTSLRRIARGSVPIISVVGRPNVGKSTLVNRICDAGARELGTIVKDEPGVTRDRIYQRAEWCGRIFDVVDTGGLLFDETDENALFVDEIREQASFALRESCAVVMVADGRSGNTKVDSEISKFLRKQIVAGDKKAQMPRVLAVNKCENPATEAEYCSEFWNLGCGEPIACSAVHGTGVAEVLDALLPGIDAELARRARVGMVTADPAMVDSRPKISVALIGRPNVGKSSLLNRFLGPGEQRSIVSDLAGTTRDAVDAELECDGTLFRFVDTAGIRRKARVKAKTTEEIMVERALRTARLSDVVLLVIDSTQPITDQDAALAKRINDDGRACVVIANKWDIKEDKDEKSTLQVEATIRTTLSEVSWAEVLFVSAMTGQRCLKVYAAIERAAASHRKRIATATLNQVIRDAMIWQPAPASTSRGSPKIYYVSQISSRPPTVVAMCNDPAIFSDNYKRYLERKLREALVFKGSPIRFVFRGRRLRDEEQEGRKRRNEENVRSVPKSGKVNRNGV